MFKRLIAVAIVAAGAAIAAPVFASSGYGPAPHYSPIDGAPASQRGQCAQTIRAEMASANANADSTSYGGVQDTTSQWGDHTAANATRSLFAHH
jgi:hypothetical protein